MIFRGMVQHLLQGFLSRMEPCLTGTGIVGEYGLAQGSCVARFMKN
jgi:hypothetical protein